MIWRWEHRDGGISTWTQFWENGNKKAESTWRGFVADGKARRWERNGKPVPGAEVEFVKGRLR
jgi:antitoxin component YwqK of YwqJK toxin-antitoxin module